MNENKVQIKAKEEAGKELSKNLAAEALGFKKPEKVKKFGMKFDPETGHRLGLGGFQSVQVETLGHVTLTERVTRILTGEMDFHASDREFEFDQDEGEWDNSDVDFDPTNDMLDKTDVHDLHKEVIERLREQARENVTTTKVEPTDKPVSEQSSPQAPSDSAAADSKKD